MTDVDALALALASGEQRDKPLFDQILSDNVPLPVASVQGTDLSRFEQKVTIGDYTKDSDQQMSSWILTSWVGGALVNQHSEGATDQRFRWANAWTLNPEQLALPPLRKIYNPAGSGDVAISSGDTKANGPLSIPLIEWGDRVFVSNGKNLYALSGDRYTWTNMTTTRIGSLAAYPQNVAASIGRQVLLFPNPGGGADIPLDINGFYIPMGEDGIQLVLASETSSVVQIQAIEPGIKAMAVKEWDGKVFALTTDGYLRIFMYDNSGVSGWEPISDDLRLPYGEHPRGLEVFYDRSGDQTVYLMTDKRVWAYDPEAQKIYPSSLRFPQHPSNGLGFTAWRDDALYVSTGFGVARYSRDGVRTDMGLDRDDGIPIGEMYPEWGTAIRSPSIPVLSHTILDMVGTQNFLVALVQAGADTSGASMYGRYFIMLWNEAGWHCIGSAVNAVLTSSGSVIYPSRLLVTETVGGYRIWWGWSARKHSEDEPTGAATTTLPGLMSVPLSRNFHGPRQQVLRTGHEFAVFGSLQTGWFDAGMKGFQKTFSHFEVYLVDPEDNLPLGGKVRVSYRLRSAPKTWVVLGDATAYGRTVLPFGVDGDGFSRGLTASEIDFKIELETSSTSRSPVIEALILKFIKLPQPGRAWVFNIPLDAENQYGMGPQEVDDYLAEKTYEGGFTRMNHQGREYRVRYAQHQMVEGTADDPFKVATANVVTVPIPGDPNWGT